LMEYDGGGGGFFAIYLKIYLKCLTYTTKKNDIIPKKLPF